eukprot:TRINITY_DN162_c1_g1_i1.p2 TRINITY_DN162_c1_g1~~TRINITY_DN162_c1_g1_i1.p2  ORF type:complete len:253 (+),score=68.81 TRINITY_DN162_c1_g1_i1:38-760(+)
MSGRNIDRPLDDIAAESGSRYRKDRRPQLGGGRGGPERRQRGGRRGRGRGGGRRGGRDDYERNLPSFTRKGAADDVEKWGHEGYQEQLRQKTPPRRYDSGDYGSKIAIKNLHYDVLQTELQALLESIGGLVRVNISSDEAGRSTGDATAVFKTEAQARKAVNEYDGRAIDGEKMSVELDGEVRIAPRKKREPSNGNRGYDRRDSRDDNRPRFRDGPRPPRQEKKRDIDASNITVRVNFDE